MVTYDSKLIYTFADRLYVQADRIVLSYVVGWGLVGFVLFGGAIALLTSASYDRVGMSTFIAGAIGALLFGAAGYSQGQAKAFGLRLQAQTALCFVAIEENTKKRES